MINITIFNNKGGVGKTTYLYHLANLLADQGKTVLMVDGDTQCNLTAYALKEPDIRRSWKKEGNSLYRAIERVSQGTGDIRERQPTRVSDNLYLVPGDMSLTSFEDRLGSTWDSAASTVLSIRTQIALFRYIKSQAEKLNADYILTDLGPNLGALNRALLGGSDYFITPLSPDLFSIKGTENLGNKLKVWNQEWNNILTTWKSGILGENVRLPKGKPMFLGYVLQQHNPRNSNEGMTKGWKIFGDEIDQAVRTNIVKKLIPLSQVIERENYALAQVPNLHSLIPYSQNANKPVYKCTGNDGLRGEHITKARDSSKLYDKIMGLLLDLNPR